ncbi:hypothetical protein SFC43_09330 [Bacteroides sp. CR5/BHMF/2]|nr:hypothetical protein [Bacteroides sp. CR5/BHMF/2]
MATIIRKEERDFQPNSGKIDGFRLFTDISRKQKGVEPQYLNFDLRRLDPGQYNAPYHFHRYAEELFMILSGSATLRTPEGLETVEEGDILFSRLAKAAHISFAITPTSRAPISICAPTSVTTSANIPIQIKSFLCPVEKRSTEANSIPISTVKPTPTKYGKSWDTGISPCPGKS